MNSNQDDFPVGFVTIAAGPVRYAEMAVDMALSLRRFHPEPIILLADYANADYARHLYASAFDRIVTLPDSLSAGRSTKFRLPDFAPLQQGVFIDADIIVLRDLNAVLAQCGLDPLRMMGRFVDATSDHRHHGVPVKKLCNIFGTEQFFTSHSGSFVYDRDRARGILKEAEVVFETMTNMSPKIGPFIGDELAFGIAAARFQMTSMDHPYPVIWSDELDGLDIHKSLKPLLHFHLTPPRDLMTIILDDIAQRRIAAGFDPKPSQTAWRAKAWKNARDPVAIMKRIRYKIRKLSGKRGAVHTE